MSYADMTRRGDLFIGNPFQLYVSTEVDIAGLARRGWKGPLDGDWSKPDQAYLDGRRMGPTAGEYAVLVTEDAFYWVEPNLTHYRRHDFVTEQTSEPIPIPIGGTSQGFSNFDTATGQLVWMDTRLAHPRPLARRWEDEGWSVGQNPDADTPGMLGQGPDGTLYVVSQTHSSIGPRMRVVNGMPVAVLSNAVNGQVTVPFSEWRPYAPPVEPPALPMPPLRTGKSVWLGADAATPQVEGNCTWSPTDMRPYFEGAEWVTSTHNLKALLFLPRESPDAEAEADLNIETALATGKPVIMVWDGADYGNPPDHHHDQRDAAYWELEFESVGVPLIPGVRCYPGDNTLQSVEDLIEAGHDQIFLVTPLYPQAWGQAAAESANLRADQILLDYPQVIGKLGFGRTRPGGWWDRLRDYWQASVVPQQGPALPEPEAVEPEPEPEPTPPPSPPMSIWERFLRWLEDLFS